MSKKSANILDDFTKDPNYSNRIKSAGGPLPEPQADTGNFFTREENRSFTPAGGLSRRWDNRFATERIPHYDAINDKFCKFSLKKKLQQQPTRKATAPASVGPRPMVGAFSSSGPGSANNRPHHLNPINNGRGSPLPPLRVGDTQQDAESITSAFTKSRNRLISLWDELGTPEEERAGLQSYITASNPSMDDVRAITEEIQRLVDVRSAAVEAEKAIELREGFLYLLQELAERFDHQGPATAAEKATTFKELSALVTPFRNASLQAVEAIVCWGDLQREPSLQGVGVRPPYLWKGVSYLHKMSGDTFFLARSRLGGLIGFELKANPLMDPRREVRNADGTPSGKAKNQPNVYIPYARLTKAESHLLEEAQRQAALRDIPGLTSTAEALGIQQRARDDDETNEAMLEEEQDWVRKQGVIRSRGSILGEQHRAATDIQRVYRSHLARRYAGALREQKEAAISIQMAVRKHLASVHVQRRRREAEAAKKIQALHRGTFTRSRIHQIRASHEAATTVQRVYRGHLARKYTDMLWYLHQCARKIQATFRGFRARKLVNGEVAAVRHMAAALIQSRWRGHVVRSNAKYNPEKSHKVVRLQAWFRGIIDRAFVRELIIAKRAATMIQNQYRITLAKRQTQQLRREREDNAWETYLGVANTAATRIQCGWRMHAAKGRVNTLRDQRKVEMDRRSIEHTLEEQLAVQDLQAQKHRSAVAIQAQMRGYLARRNFQMIRHLIYSATQIQKVVRGHLSRQHSRGQRSVLMQHMEEQLSAVGLRDTIPSIVEQAKSAIYAADESVGAQTAAADNDDHEEPIADFEPLSKNVSATDASPAEGVSVATIDANNDITLISPSEPSISPSEHPLHNNATNASSSSATPSTSTEPVHEDISPLPAREQEDSRVDDNVDIPSGDPEWSVTQEAMVQTLPPPTAADLQVLEDAAALIQRNVRGYQSRGAGSSNKQSRVAKQKASSDSHAQCSEYAATILQRNLAPRAQYLSKSRNHRIATKQASRLATGQEREAAAMIMGQLVPVAKARSEADIKRSRREAANVAAKRDAINAERQYAASTIAIGLMPLVPIKEASRLAANRNTQSATTACTQEADYAREIMGRFLTAVAAKQRSSLARGEKASEFFEAQVGEQAYAARMIQCALRVRQAKCDVSTKRQQASDAKVVNALLDMAQSVRDSVEESEDAEYRQLIVKETSDGLVASALLGALATSQRTTDSPNKSAPSTPEKEPSAATPTASAISTPPTTPVVAAVATTPLPEVDTVSSTPEVDATPIIPAMTTTPQTPEAPAAIQAEEPTAITPTKSDDEEEVAKVDVVVDATTATPVVVAPIEERKEKEVTPKASPTKPSASLPVIESSDSESDMEVDVRPPTAPVMDAIQPYKDGGIPTPEETATQVQAILRCWHSALIVDYWAEKKIQGAHHAKETAASTTIQSCFRSHKARGEVDALRTKKAADDKAAQEQQLIADYDTAVEILRTEENELRRAQVEAANQEAAAFVNAERKEQAKAAAQTSAAITIQCAWRCYNARFMRRWMHSVRDEKRANAAAVERSELEVAAAHKIQCATRQRQARNRTTALREDKAAKRKELMDREAKLHGSATSIQCMVRQRNARDKLHFLQEQKQNKEKNEAAKKAAEQARRLQELKDIEATKVRTVEEHAAATKIQCAYRSYNARFERKWRADNKARGGDGTRPSTTSSRGPRENSAVARVHANRLDELRAAELRAQTEDGPNPYAAESHHEEL